MDSEMPTFRSIRVYPSFSRIRIVQALFALYSVLSTLLFCPIPFGRCSLSLFKLRFLIAHMASPNFSYKLNSDTTLLITYLKHFNCKGYNIHLYLIFMVICLYSIPTFYWHIYDIVSRADHIFHWMFMINWCLFCKKHHLWLFNM